MLFFTWLEIDLQRVIEPKRGVAGYFRRRRRNDRWMDRQTDDRSLNRRVRLLVLFRLLDVRAAVHVFRARVYWILLATLRYFFIDDTRVLVILFIFVPGGDVRLASGADTARSFLVAPTPRCNKQRHDRSRQKCVCGSLFLFFIFCSVLSIIFFFLFFCISLFFISVLFDSIIQGWRIFFGFINDSIFALWTIVTGLVSGVSVVSRYSTFRSILIVQDRLSFFLRNLQTRELYAGVRAFLSFAL